MSHGSSLTTYPTHSVTVSIVVHRQWALARPLIEQLDRYCHASIAKVVLTLNLPEALDIDSHWRFPVDVIENSKPKGFGANHNGAFAHCNTEWFLVLNPDIRFDDDAIGAMLSRAAPDAGLMAPRIQEPGKPQMEPHRGLLTPLELFQRRRPGYQPPQEPAWVAGMCMLVRAKAFTQVAGFDQRYFMYCEDFDLCARLRIGGWRIQIDEATVVLHLAQRASNRSLQPLLWHLRSFAKVWTSAAFWRFRRCLRSEGTPTLNKG